MRKIITFDDLPNKIEQIQSQGRIVLIGGCFDILHTGHREFLKEAKKQGDILLLLLESDDSIKKRKGEKRPINNQKVRSSVLSSIPDVSYIIPLPLFEKNEDYYKLTNTIKPDIIAVTENDPLLEIKKDQAKMVGGKVVEVLKRIPNLSTTELIKQTI